MELPPIPFPLDARAMIRRATCGANANDPVLPLQPPSPVRRLTRALRPPRRDA
jgi:hypothetical protein